MVTLITRDSKGKVRVIEFTLTHYENPEYYEISRKSGLYQGKMVSQPSLKIEKGKVKRTLKEQAELEFNSLIKKAKDKGYKDIKDLGYDNLNFDPDKVLPKEKRDQNGAVKPMLAKLIESVPESTLSKFTNFFISRKIDGGRALFFYKDGEIHTSSRGGGNYDYPTSHIRNNQKLIDYFKLHPDLVLDGELYVFGYSLQRLSGCMRLEDGELPFKLQYYVYDIVDLNKPFKERYKIIQQLKNDLNLGFDPNKSFKDDELMIQILPQVEIKNDKTEIWKLHDQYVAEGWEGAVLRDPDSLYKPGSRGWLKCKRRKDSEFTTIGYELGLRGVEDLVFKMKTDDGKEFLAKPVGSREVKDSLFADINNIIGKKATCTYFYLSDDGVPLQPVWKSVRLDKDI